MNQLKHISIILLLFLGCVPAVHAYDKEAGEAAKLASGAAITVQKKPDIRAKVLENYLESVQSPMAPYAEVFVREADKYELDWRLVPAIAGLESSFGKYIPAGSYNAFGWGIFTGKTSGKTFQSWEDAISTVSQGLKEKYIDDGLITIESIGNRYAASQTWAARIHIIMNRFSMPETNHDFVETLAVTL